MRKKQVLILLIVLFACLVARPLDFWIGLLVSDAAANLLGSIESLIGILAVMLVLLNKKVQKQ